MKPMLTPQQLLAAISASGYFKRSSFDPSSLCSLLEDKLNIEHGHAIDLLTEAGLITFQYSSDPGLAPRDVLDMWKLNLTDAGKKSLAETDL